MMMATATFAAIASDNTTTSGLGSGLGSSGRLEIAVAISNSFHAVVFTVVARIQNFTQFGQKT